MAMLLSPVHATKHNTKPRKNERHGHIQYKLTLFIFIAQLTFYSVLITTMSTIKITTRQKLPLQFCQHLRDWRETE